MAFAVSLFGPSGEPLWWSLNRDLYLELIRIQNGRLYITRAGQFHALEGSSLELPPTEFGVPTTAIIRAQFAHRPLMLLPNRLAGLVILDAIALLASVTYRAAAGMNISRDGDKNLRIDIVHPEGATKLAGDECTVFCPDGDSRTGFHPCITCQQGEYYIKVCC